MDKSRKVQTIVQLFLQINFRFFIMKSTKPSKSALCTAFKLATAKYQKSLIELSDCLDCQKSKGKLLKAAKKAGKLIEVTRPILESGMVK